MTKPYVSPPGIPVRQTPRALCFSARFIRVVSRLLFRRFIREVCIGHARKIVQDDVEARGRNAEGLKDDGLPEGREWVSPSEAEMIYGFSRRTLGRVLKEAEAQGRPVRVIRLRFRNGADLAASRRRPCIRINRVSLEEYLDFCSREGEEKA